MKSLFRIFCFTAICFTVVSAQNLNDSKPSATNLNTAISSTTMTLSDSDRRFVFYASGMFLVSKKDPYQLGNARGARIYAGFDYNGKRFTLSYQDIAFTDFTHPQQHSVQIGPRFDFGGENWRTVIRPQVGFAHEFKNRFDSNHNDIVFRVRNETLITRYVLAKVDFLASKQVSGIKFSDKMDKTLQTLQVGANLTRKLTGSVGYDRYDTGIPWRYSNKGPYFEGLWRGKNADVSFRYRPPRNFGQLPIKLGGIEIGVALAFGSVK